MSTITRPTPGQVEERTALDTPAPTVDGRRLHGLIPYNVESRDLGGFREIIEPGALADADLSDLIATREHDRSKLLGRHPTTLNVEDRAEGFAWSVELPQSPVGEDVRVAIERGDLRSTSWRMVVGEDEWRGDVRHVKRIAELRDVTVTAAPAYGDAAPAEYRSTPEPDPTPPAPVEPITAEEATMQTTDRDSGTGLAVEDRTATTETPTVEHRIIDALRSVPKGENRALTTSASISPGELSTFLFDTLRAASVALRTGLSVISTDKDSITYPTLTADVSPGWYAEAATITPGDPTFSTITATPRKLAHLVQMSNEVIDDSDPSIVDVLNTHLLAMLALKLDIGIFEGSGTAPEIRGLKNVSGIQTISMGANGAALASLDTIADAINLLEAANTTATAIVMAPRTWNTIRKFKATTNEYIVTTPTSGTPRTLFGVPVYVSSQLSITETQGTATNASSIYVFNAAQVVYVRRQEVELELDRSRLFNSDQSEMRAKLRGDLIVPNPAAVVRIVGVTP